MMACLLFTDGSDSVRLYQVFLREGKAHIFTELAMPSPSKAQPLAWANEDEPSVVRVFSADAAVPSKIRGRKRKDRTFLPHPPSPALAGHNQQQKNEPNTEDTRSAEDGDESLPDHAAAGPAPNKCVARAAGKAQSISIDAASSAVDAPPSEVAVVNEEAFVPEED